MLPPPSLSAGMHRARRQRGAITILAAFGLALLLGSALLAVDVGSMFYTRRHLQTVADTAALSAVNSIPSAYAIAVATAGANNFPLGGAKSNTVSTVAGHYDFVSSSFTAGGSPSDQNAVQVTVTTNQPYFFIAGTRSVMATATAVRNDVAGLSVGSGLASIDTEKSALLNGLLGGLLDTTVKLDVMSYNGLIGTNVRLLDLVRAEGHVGTVQELLALDLSVPQVLNLVATALNQKDLATVDANVLNAINLLSAEVPGSLHLRLGDLIDASQAPGNAAADVQVNLMQLVTLAAQVANGRNFLNIPVLGLDLGGLASLDVALSLIERPQIAVGPPGQDSSGAWRTQAHTAQWRVKLELSVLKALDGGLVRLPIYLEVAAADAKLDSIDCASPRDSSTVNVLANSSIARAYVGDVNADAMTNVTKAATVEPATIVNVLGLLTVTARAAIDLPGGAADQQFHGPYNFTNTQTTSGLSTSGLFNSLADNLVLDIDLLGINLGLGGLLRSLRALLDPIFLLLDAILAPVLQLLGVQLGYGDVTVFYLKCGAPMLVR